MAASPVLDSKGRFEELPKHICHPLLALLRKMKIINGRLITGEDICEKSTRNQDDPKSTRQPSLNQPVAVTEWRQGDFEHDDNSVRVTDGSQKSAQRPFKLGRRYFPEYVIATNLKEYQIMIGINSGRAWLGGFYSCAGLRQIDNLNVMLFSDELWPANDLFVANARRD
jgi:hypothetical protein